MTKQYLLLGALIVLFTFSKCKKEPSENYLLNQVAASETGIDFKNQLTEDANHSIINYIYFYNGGGVATGDINNDGLPDLCFVSNQNQNKLYLNKGDFKFEDITKKSKIESNADWNTGVTMVDINNDGYLDIYVCAVSQLLDFQGHNELYINNGDNTFTEKSAEYGLDFKGYSTQSYFFDYDKDGDLDVYIVNHAVHTNLSHGKASKRNKRMPLVGDVLLQNNNGKFTDVSTEANIFGGVNGYGLSASIADFNNDGWDDIYVCNDFHEDDYYYINNKNGTFSEELASKFSTISRFSMGSDAADITGNGYQDIITLDMLPNDEKVLKETEGDDAMLNMQANLKNLGYRDQYSRNMLQINQNGEYFNETALYNGVADTDWSWSPLFADFNNDGHQDLFISNGILRRPNSLDFKKYVSSTFKKYGQKKGVDWLYKSINEMPSGSVPNQIFKGNSSRFKETTGNWLAKEASLSNGAVYVDLDLDGDLDLVTNNVNAPAGIFKNNSSATTKSASFQLAYIESNKEAIGAKVHLYSNGKKQTKQIFKSRGFLSSTEAKVHFGLDTIAKIDSVLVIWPNLEVQKIEGISANQLTKITYSSTKRLFKADAKNSINQTFKEENLIDYVHEEDSYNDFFSEKLLPYKVSTLGPAMAIADIDNNGFEDIFIGGSSGNAAALYLNSGTSFKKNIPAVFETDKAFEDNDAAFIDIDKDGDLDLYVASGIHEKRNQNYEVDRLYINTNGSFKRSENKTLINPLNTSTIIAYDHNKDGDEDIFIGNLSNPGSFGATVNSAILNNDGKGNYTIHLKFNFNGRVTDAVWADVNNDDQKDLLIASEWDTPKIYINNNGNFTLQELPESLHGLWQSIATFDVDLDGDQDIVLGNWGENNRFTKYIENPIYFYFGDFDKNGKKESIITYKVGDDYYPLNTKDELASQMNVMSKKFVNHANFALTPFNKIFNDSIIAKAKRSQINTLSSGYLENNNGKFSDFVPFEASLQMGPITSFTKVNINNKDQLLISGNSLKVNTYHGGYTALKGYFMGDAKNVEPVSKYGIQPFHNQIKETTVVKMKNKNLLLVLANNDSLKTYSFK
ncbi:VCBS repeat-containing protein [Polaribacter sp. P097]|uniref:VCBS repeat-containing protein n=1 Tax=Polaribacter sp. P097 TaxID=3117398 RepID=UPI002FE0458A